MQTIKMVLTYEIDDECYEDMRNEESLTQRDNWENVLREIATDMLYDIKHKNYEQTLDNTGIRHYSISTGNWEPIFEM